MSISQIAILIAALLFSSLLHLTHRYLFSPLSKLPGPWYPFPPSLPPPANPHQVHHPHLAPPKLPLPHGHPQRLHPRPPLLPRPHCAPLPHTILLLHSRSTPRNLHRQLPQKPLVRPIERAPPPPAVHNDQPLARARAPPSPPPRIQQKAPRLDGRGCSGEYGSCGGEDSGGVGEAGGGVGGGVVDMYRWWGFMATDTVGVFGVWEVI